MEPQEVLQREIPSPLAGEGVFGTAPSSHSSLAALCAVLALGASLRLYALSEESLWRDEISSITIAQLDLIRMVQNRAADIHPPLYYFLLHYWTALFGHSEGAVRALSVVFGVLTIPVMYAVGRRLFDERVGLLSALIIALAEFHIRYAQEAKGYSLLALLALLSMYYIRAVPAGSCVVGTVRLCRIERAPYLHSRLRIAVFCSPESLPACLTLLLRTADCPFWTYLGQDARRGLLTVCTLVTRANRASGQSSARVLDRTAHGPRGPKHIHRVCWLASLTFRVLAFCGVGDSRKKG
jgi:hypothetical protein